MRHYFNPMSRAATSDWMLKELDAAHERVVVDIQAGEQDPPEYRAINPMGKVPTLVDGDAVVTEAAAICAYLADKFADKGLAPSPGSTERGKISAALRAVAGPPGMVIRPGQWKEAKAAIAAGKDINYEGAVGNNDFDKNGDVTAIFSVNNVGDDGSWNMVSIMK